MKRKKHRRLPSIYTLIITLMLSVGAYQLGSLLSERYIVTQSHSVSEVEKKDTPLVAAAPSSEYSYTKEILQLTKEHTIKNVLLTAYEASEVSCGASADGITKTGTRVVAGRTIAVDPRVIPLGSKVIINNHTYIAEDVGGKVTGNHIDIYMNTVSECLNFGRRYADVVWLEDYEVLRTYKHTYRDGKIVDTEVVAEEVIE